MSEQLKPCPRTMWREEIAISPAYPTGGAFYHETLPTNHADLVLDEYTRPAPAVAVKPLVWEGFVSGSYEITVKEGGIANLHNHGSRDEDGEPDYLQGGYLTLVSLDDLKATAQADYETRILSAIQTRPEPVTRAEGSQIYCTICKSTNHAKCKHPEICRPEPDTAALVEALRITASGPSRQEHVGNWVRYAMKEARAALSAYEALRLQNVDEVTNG